MAGFRDRFARAFDQLPGSLDHQFEPIKTRLSEVVFKKCWIEGRVDSGVLDNFDEYIHIYIYFFLEIFY